MIRTMLTTALLLSCWRANAESYSVWKARIDQDGSGELLEAQRKFIEKQVGRAGSDPQRFQYNPDPQRLEKLSQAVSAAVQTQDWKTLVEAFDRLFTYNNRDWVQAVGYDPNSSEGRQALAALANFWEGVWTQQCAQALDRRAAAETDKERKQWSEAYRTANAGRLASQRRAAAYQRTAAGYVEQATQAIAERQYEVAIELLDEALRLDSKSAAALVARATARVDLGDYEAGIHDADEALRLDLKQTAAFVIRGTAHQRQEKYELAKNDFDEANRLDPKSAEALERRAWLMATCPDEKHRDGKSAVRDALRACELADWSPQLYGTLAAAYAESGQFDIAVKWQRQLVGNLLATGKPTALAKHQLAKYVRRQPYREFPVAPKYRSALAGYRPVGSDK